MKVGDVIQYTGFKKKVLTGIIIETGVYAGNRDILVMWEDGEIFTEERRHMEAIRDAKTR